MAKYSIDICSAFFYSNYTSPVSDPHRNKKINGFVFFRTLTQNQMVFKKLSIQNNSFEEEGFRKVKEHLVDFIDGKISNQIK